MQASERKVTSSTPGLNLYGDQAKPAGAGFGVDVASQRSDDLDEACLAHIREQVLLQKPVRAADLGCGHGGQAIRMAAAGASTTAVDRENHVAEIFSAAARANVMIDFVQADIASWCEIVGEKFNILSCQRTIHYLPFADAMETLIKMHRVMAPEGKLFISASGLDSELGDGYDKIVDRARRFSKLEEKMADKHHIHQEVCLYTEEDMAALLAGANFKAEKIYRSEFGNIKAIATRINIEPVVADVE